MINRVSRFYSVGRHSIKEESEFVGNLYWDRNTDLVIDFEDQDKEIVESNFAPVGNILASMVAFIDAMYGIDMEVGKQFEIDYLKLNGANIDLCEELLREVASNELGKKSIDHYDTDNIKVISGNHRIAQSSTEWEQSKQLFRQVNVDIYGKLSLEIHLCSFLDEEDGFRLHSCIDDFEILTTNRYTREIVDGLAHQFYKHMLSILFDEEWSNANQLDDLMSGLNAKLL